MTFVSPKELGSTPQNIGEGEESLSSRQWSIVDQTSSAVSNELQLFPSESGASRSSKFAGLGFIESAGDDPRLDDLL